MALRSRAPLASGAFRRDRFFNWAPPRTRGLIRDVIKVVAEQLYVEIHTILVN